METTSNVMRFFFLLLLILFSRYGLAEDKLTTGVGSDLNLSDLHARMENQIGRSNIGDGSESIDILSCMQGYTTTDAISVNGGFDLPITLMYFNVQNYNQDSTSRIFGKRWDIHFRGIRSNATSAGLPVDLSPQSADLNHGSKSALQEANESAQLIPMKTAMVSYKS